MGRESGEKSGAAKFVLLLSSEKRANIEEHFLQRVLLERVPGAPGTASYQPAAQGTVWRRRLRFEQERTGFKAAGAEVFASSDLRHVLLVSGGQVFGGLR